MCKFFWVVCKYTYSCMDKTNTWLSTWAPWAKCHKMPHLGLELVLRKNGEWSAGWNLSLWNCKFFDKFSAKCQVPDFLRSVPGSEWHPMVLCGLSVLPCVLNTWAQGHEISNIALCHTDDPSSTSGVRPNIYTYINRLDTVMFHKYFLSSEGDCDIVGSLNENPSLCRLIAWHHHNVMR
jgi:hypothetical protein